MLVHGPIDVAVAIAAAESDEALIDRPTRFVPRAGPPQPQHRIGYLAQIGPSNSLGVSDGERTPERAVHGVDDLIRPLQVQLRRQEGVPHPGALRGHLQAEPESRRGSHQERIPLEVFVEGLQDHLAGDPDPEVSLLAIARSLPIVRIGHGHLNLPALFRGAREFFRAFLELWHTPEMTSPFTRRPVASTSDHRAHRTRPGPRQTAYPPGRRRPPGPRGRSEEHP